MAKPQVIQGTWEELSAHAEGHKDRTDLTLIIPCEDCAEIGGPKEPQTLADVLYGKTGLVSFDPPDLSQDTGKKFAALLEERQAAKRQ